jgi:hypothetical protein
VFVQLMPQIMMEQFSVASSSIYGFYQHLSAHVTRLLGTSRWIGDWLIKMLVKTDFCGKKLFTLTR